MTLSHTLHYAIRPDADTWVDRIDAACVVLEKAFPPEVGAYSADVVPPEAARALWALQILQRSKSAPEDPQLMREAAPLLQTLRAVDAEFPQIREENVTPRSHPAQPQALGWLNYWSADTCQYLGFPDASRDEALLR